MVSRTRGGAFAPVAPSARQNLRSADPPPAVTELVEDLQSMQAEMMKDSAALKQRLREVRWRPHECPAVTAALELQQPRSGGRHPAVYAPA
jgi:hypothetical protein